MVSTSLLTLQNNNASYFSSYMVSVPYCCLWTLKSAFSKTVNDSKQYSQSQVIKCAAVEFH